MKLRSFFLFLAVSLVASRGAAAEPRRILCYGDSTTWGQVGNDGFASGQSYPCCLQKILGDKYDVKNISLGGSCAIDMLVWRGVRELRTKPYYSLGNKSVLNDIVLKKDGSFTGIAFTGGSNPFCFVSTGSDDVGLKYNGYPVYGNCNEAAGLFWPSHDGAAFTQAEATQIGLTGNRSGQRAWSDYGEHRAQGIGRCRCYYDPNDGAKYADVEIRYSSSLFAAMRLLEPRDADVTIPAGSKIVPIDTTETWKSDLHIIMFGLNDTGVLKSNKYWMLIKEAADRIVADGGRYLVLMSHSACASRIADTKMKEYFGDRYLDLYAKFTEKDENGDYKSFAYAENLGYTNVRTTELQTSAKIPLTFATDKYHPLPIAYDLMAHWVYDKLVALGELEGDEPEPGVAAVPVAATGLTYSGKAQTGVAARTGCTVTGGTATDAGEYEATATLADGCGKWADGSTEKTRTIAWSIAKGRNSWTANPSVSPATWVAGEAPATILISNGSNAFSAAVTCDTTADALKALGEGEHTVTFTAAGCGNYDAIAKTVTVTVTAGEAPGPTPGEGVPVLTAPADGATVAMLTDRQKQAIAHGGESWDGGNLGDNKAHPVVLSWTGTTGPARVTVVRVKDGSALIDATTDAGTLDAYNMLLGEEYRWTVTTASGSASRTFAVELQAPRVIMVQASNETDIAELNMRDLGGWVGKDGHRVKQGLLYRSRKLSEPYPAGYDPAAVDGRGYPLMSDAAIFVMTNRFGIRTELDFRSPNDQARGIVRSALGPNVEYINQGMLQPEMLILQSSVGNAMLKANLDVIFDRSKYPLDFHCKDGNSRTGGLAYYLLGLLGVDIRDAAADYMWTKYSTGKAWTWEATDFKFMYANVTTNHVFTAADGTVYDRGTNFMAVCESFTLANGYTMAQIEAFREFMLEGYEPGEDPVDPPTPPDPPHVHDWNAWVTNVVPQVGIAGERQRTCKGCDKVEVETLDPLPDPGPGPTPGPTPVEGLPEGYTAAAAVTSATGDSVWFDTNHKPTSDTVSQIKFTFTKDGGAGLYGYLSPSADDANDYRLAATSGKWMLDLGDNKKRIGPFGPAPACGTAKANATNHLEIGNYYVKDLAADATLASVEPVTFTRDYTLRIFGKQGGYAAYGSVYCLKIFEKGTLVHDFVPCVSPDGVTGLFDRCTSSFHKPDGTFAKVEVADAWTMPESDSPEAIRAALAADGFGAAAQRAFADSASYAAFKGFCRRSLKLDDPKDPSKSGRRANALWGYALGASSVPDEEIGSADVTVVSLARSASAGSFVLKVRVGGLEPNAAAAVQAALDAAVSAEGGRSLAEMARENVSVAGRVEGGVLAVTVVPKEPSPNAFFARAVLGR